MKLAVNTILKTILEIFERLKGYFSDADEKDLKAIINRHPDRADFFLYLCETFKIDPKYVRQPVAYIKNQEPQTNQLSLYH